ncbi:DUF6879 family protein [Streptosporangium saharense]|uniref:DUF6879 family protein n=1 Tax=Streptosporangium saharense TaxID=1706840 RepID=UPI0036820411
MRVVTEPFSDYIRWEHEGTPLNLELGEDIRWLPRHRIPAGAVLPVDNAEVIVGRFDADGRPTERELIKDSTVVAQCARVRDLLWWLATPHADYRPPVV